MKPKKLKLWAVVNARGSASLECGTPILHNNRTDAFDMCMDGERPVRVLVTVTEVRDGRRKK